MSIQTFILVKERCLLAHMNVRTEMHGDERDPAVDLKFEFSSANNLLSKLHQDLRATFYCGDANQDMVTPDNMPHLRFPFMGPVPWELEIPRTRLRIHDADKPENDIVLGGGKTNKFKLVMKNGGTVEWSFRCQFSKPDEDIVAKLMRALNQRVPVSLECAEEEEEGDNFDKVDKPKACSMRRRPIWPSRRPTMLSTPTLTKTRRRQHRPPTLRRSHGRSAAASGRPVVASNN
jgi:hypothetical protein